MYKLFTKFSQVIIILECEKKCQHMVLFFLMWFSYHVLSLMLHTVPFECDWKKSKQPNFKVMALVNLPNETDVDMHQSLQRNQWSYQNTLLFNMKEKANKK